MASFPSSVLPKDISPAVKRDKGLAEFSPKLARTASLAADQALAELQSGPDGLSEEEAKHRIDIFGPNVVTRERRFTRLTLLLRACLNPLVILLVVLAVISFATAETASDLVGGGLMVVMWCWGFLCDSFRKRARTRPPRGSKR